MKKLTLCILSTFLLLSLVPMQLKGVSVPTAVPVSSAKPAESEEAEILLSRLEEIKAMDKSGLSSSEKKVLRKEVRSIKSDLKDIGRGVYLSVGSIIIIVLLLILLL